MSNKFKEYRKNKGTIDKTTPKNTPQRNGSAERLNQTLFGMTRCMFIDRGMQQHSGELESDMQTKSETDVLQKRKEPKPILKN